MESTIQRSKQLYGNHSLVIVVGEVTAKIPGCNAYVPPFQDGTTTSTEKSLALALFVEEVQKYECLSLQQIFPQNIETRQEKELLRSN